MGMTRWHNADANYLDNNILPSLPATVPNIAPIYIKILMPLLNPIPQVWRKDSLVCVKVNIAKIMKYSVSLQDICLQTFPCHTDSVWDLKLHNTTVVKDLNYKNYKTIKYFPCQATAGLDGAVILYDFVSDFDLRVRCYIQVSQSALAMDFFLPKKQFGH